MDPSTTNYPERYVTDDENPNYFRYQQRPKSLLGCGAGEAAGKDGTIIASFEGEYWLDPDLTLIDEPNANHFIWICDQWQLFSVSHFHGKRIHTRAGIEASWKRFDRD